MSIGFRVRGLLRSDLGVLLALALVRFAVHMLTNGQYGWHRDELALLDDARHLAWGYVAYPPVTPAVARLGLALFGPSLVGVRMFAVLAQCAAMVLAGLIARDLGGSRTAQVVTALAVATSTASVFMSVTLMYVSIDYLWWVLATWCLVRRVRTDDPRWWLGVGAAIGLGTMTKYTMAFLVVGIVLGTLLTPLRRDLRSRWLWSGVALACLLFVPNLIWQIRHDFISLQFLGTIHERDIRIGRTDAFLLGQLYVSTNGLSLPIWLAGLISLLFLPTGRRYRALGWMYVAPLALFLVLRGRDYYLAPAYPMLLAGGTVAWQGWLAGRSRRARRIAMGYACVALVLWAGLAAALAMPLAPVNSPVWDMAAEVHDNFTEQIGWPDLVEAVADVYYALPDAERAGAGILAGNYGEAGALSLYGPAHGLPAPISAINSYWLRGYGEDGPYTAIVLGFDAGGANTYFGDCEFVRRVTNRYGVRNEETEDYPGIFVCRRPLAPWSALWPGMRHFG